MTKKIISCERGENSKTFEAQNGKTIYVESCGIHVERMWNSCGTFKIMWNSCGTHVELMLNFQNHVEFMWNLCGTHVELMWNDVERCGTMLNDVERC